MIVGPRMHSCLRVHLGSQVAREKMQFADVIGRVQVKSSGSEEPQNAEPGEKGGQRECFVGPHCQPGTLPEAEAVPVAGRSRAGGSASALG